jgi:hypothetical protein
MRWRAAQQTAAPSTSPPTRTQRDVVYLVAGHHVRAAMDRMFSANRCIELISFKKRFRAARWLRKVNDKDRCP